MHAFQLFKRPLLGTSGRDEPRLRVHVVIVPQHRQMVTVKHDDRRLIRLLEVIDQQLQAAVGIACALHVSFQRIFGLGGLQASVLIGLSPYRLSS